MTGRPAAVDCRPTARVGLMRGAPPRPAPSQIIAPHDLRPAGGAFSPGQFSGVGRGVWEREGSVRNCPESGPLLNAPVNSERFEHTPVKARSPFRLGIPAEGLAQRGRWIVVRHVPSKLLVLRVGVGRGGLEGRGGVPGAGPTRNCPPEWGRGGVSCAEAGAAGSTETSECADMPIGHEGTARRILSIAACEEHPRKPPKRPRICAICFPPPQNSHYRPYLGPLQVAKARASGVAVPNGLRLRVAMVIFQMHNTSEQCPINHRSIACQT